MLRIGLLRFASLAMTFEGSLSQSEHIFDNYYSIARKTDISQLELKPVLGKFCTVNPANWNRPSFNHLK
jgi:hypothetical protein